MPLTALAFFLVQAQSGAIANSGPTPAITQTMAKPDLAATSKLINDYRSKLYTEGKDGKPLTRAELSAVVAAYAQSVLASVDVKAVSDSEASEWAQLYSEANLEDQATLLQKRAISYHNVQLMFANEGLIRKLLVAGKDDEAFYMIKHTADYNASMVGMIGEVVMGTCRGLKYDKTKPAFVEKCLKALMAKVDTGPSALGPDQNSMADYVFVDLNVKLLEMRYELKPDPAILAQLKALRVRFANSPSKNAFGQNPAHRIDEFFDKANAIGTPAPAVTFEKSIGDFKGLAALKGKVVFLDFMAHWCGPCKAALPGIQKMQSDFGPQGFQVVSITSFYGYYGAQKPVTPTQEFTLMRDFVKQYKMDWPVAFDEKQVTHSKYRVGAIPHMVVIDRKGKIRKILVGFSPEAEAETLALVKSLLAEAP